MNRIVCISTAVAILTGFVWDIRESSAKTASSGIHVTAKVKSVLALSLDHQESTLKITEKDTRNGYVDIVSGTIYKVRTNSREGYTLLFEGRASNVNRIWVMDGGRNIELPGTGGFMHLPYAGGRFGETKVLSYRFFLSQNTKPGSYSWPLVMEASHY